jgi:hypothetical protein
LVEENSIECIATLISALKTLSKGEKNTRRDG